MMFDKEEIRKGNAGIGPCVLPERDAYRSALRELDWAESDNVGMPWIIRVLTREAITSIGNALDLFDIGYCDAACYALRQAIELSTIFVFFDELPADKRKETIAIWANAESKGRFPQRSEIEKKLESQQCLYADLKRRMPKFFAKVKKGIPRLNKHIHKQGYEFLYESRRVSRQQVCDSIFRDQLSEYATFVELAISVVALMKLTIDPMPLALSDENLANRLPGLIGLPYSEAFQEKYLGVEAVEEFKNTEIYSSFKESVMTRPENNPAVYSLKNDYCLDRADINAFVDQIDHLDFKERIVVACAICSEKIACFYYGDGLIHYLTEMRSKQLHMGCFSSSEFKDVRLGNIRRNNPFRGVFLTWFSVYDGDTLFVEHNEPLSDLEYLQLCEIIEKLNGAARIWEAELVEQAGSIKIAINKVDTESK